MIFKDKPSELLFGYC